MLRMHIRELAAAQDKALLQARASVILKSIEELEEFQKAKTILIYMSMEGEVPTRGLIEKWSDNKTFVLPRLVSSTDMELRKYSPEHLISGAFGIQEPDEGSEPIDYQSVELAIIPGIAFAPHSETNAPEIYSGKYLRLGRGRGYYDRLLAKLNCPTVGICYPYNIVQSVPQNEWDQCVDKCLF